MNNLAKPLTILVCLFIDFGATAQAQETRQDWLIDNASMIASFEQPDTDQPRFELGNGLVKRTFLIKPTIAATVGLENVVNGEAILRAVKPEARISVNGLDDARNAPGVHLILTGNDVAGIGSVQCIGMGPTKDGSPIDVPAYPVL